MTCTSPRPRHAWGCCARGDYAAAAARMEQGLPLARGSDDPAISAASSATWDMFHWCWGIIDEHANCSVRRWPSSARMAIVHGSPVPGGRPASWLPRSLSGSAPVWSGGRIARGRGAPLRPSVQTVYAPIVDQARMALGEVAFAAAWSVERLVVGGGDRRGPRRGERASRDYDYFCGDCSSLRSHSRVGGVATRRPGAPMARSPRCCSSACPPSSVT